MGMRLKGSGFTFSINIGKKSVRCDVACFLQNVPPSPPPQHLSKKPSTHSIKDSLGPNPKEQKSTINICSDRKTRHIQSTESSRSWRKVREPFGK